MFLVVFFFRLYFVFGGDPKRSVEIYGLPFLPQSCWPNESVGCTCWPTFFHLSWVMGPFSPAGHFYFVYRSLATICVRQPNCQ